MNRLIIVLSMLALAALSGCVSPPPKPDDPYYAPVLPRTPLPAAQNNGSIYQAGFENNLFDDRKAHRVPIGAGDEIAVEVIGEISAGKNVVIASVDLA
jgi:flagellar L-ring protein precursor FlgH